MRQTRIHFTDRNSLQAFLAGIEFAHEYGSVEVDSIHFDPTKRPEVHGTILLVEEDMEDEERDYELNSDSDEALVKLDPEDL